MKTILAFSLLIVVAMARPDVRQVNEAECPPGTPIRCPVGSGSSKYSLNSLLYPGFHIILILIPPKSFFENFQS